MNTKLDKKAVDSLLVLHKEYSESLASVLHLAFAQIRSYYDKLYEITDAYPELDKIADQIDFPLDQLLTNIKLLEKVFDDLIRPIAPERFAKKDNKASIPGISVISRLLNSTDRLFRLYAQLELEGDDVGQDFKKIVAEINLLCIIFLQYLKENYTGEN